MAGAGGFFTVGSNESPKLVMAGLLGPVVLEETIDAPNALETCHSELTAALVEGNATGGADMGPLPFVGLPRRIGDMPAVSTERWVPE